MDTAEVGTPTAPLFRLTCMLAGVDPGLIAACPPRDRDGVRLLCGLMALVWVWQSIVFAAVAHLMLAQAGEIRGELIAVAMLLATIILLLDATVVMRPSWTSVGHEELRRGGLAIPIPALARIKGGVFLALRLALSLVVGTLVALFVSLVLYGKDIAGQLAAEHAARNAPVIAVATRLLDDRLVRNIGAQAELRARLAAADRAADHLRAGLTERADPATTGASAELARAERAREQAEAQVARRRRRGDAPGLARARHRLETATAGRAAARDRLDEAESRTISRACGRDTALTGQLATLDAQRRQDLDRLALAGAEQRTMLDGRSASIQEAVGADPTYAARDDGLLARLRALKVLSADPWVGAVVLLLEAFFAGIELAAVFAKLLGFVPSTYATRLAREDRLRQVATAREIAGALGAPEQPIAGSARPLHTDALGTPSANGMPVIDRSVGILSGSPPVAEERDRDVPPAHERDARDDQRSPVWDRATSSTEDETGPSLDASDEMPPRRRRGRPPKVR